MPTAPSHLPLGHRRTVVSVMTLALAFSACGAPAGTPTAPALTDRASASSPSQASATEAPSASATPVAKLSLAPSPVSVEPSPSAIASSSEFSVISTLHGLTELPHRIHWEGMPSGSASDVMEVDFLIDDQLAAVEHKAPYSYAGDGSWLVTSFLEPGAHTFVTRAIAQDDRTAVETVTATVDVAPKPPTAIVGRWSRTVGGDDPGVWHVTINNIGWLFDDPHGGGQNQDAAYPASGKVEIGGAILEPLLGEYDRDGSFCDGGDPDGVFSYSVSADGTQLTLSADAPVCYQFLIEGTWQRQP